MTKIIRPRSIKDIKGRVAVAELQRAHYIIVLLACAFSVFLIFNMISIFVVDLWLGSIAVALLLIISALSLATAISLKK
jgi:hypothetical protein